MSKSHHISTFDDIIKNRATFQVVWFFRYCALTNTSVIMKMAPFTLKCRSSMENKFRLFSNPINSVCCYWIYKIYQINLYWKLMCKSCNGRLFSDYSPAAWLWPYYKVLHHTDVEARPNENKIYRKSNDVSGFCAWSIEAKFRYHFWSMVLH